MKKAQIFAFDLSTALIIFVLFIVVLFSLFISSNRGETEQINIELEFLFANLENNVRSDADTTNDFLAGYRMQPIALNNFATITNIDDYIVGNTENAHGIGLSSEAFDTCMYIIDTDGSRLNMNGKEAIGQVLSGSCHDAITSGQNPCNEYDRSLGLFRPVLYDTGDPDTSRIVQLNVVVCIV